MELNADLGGRRSQPMSKKNRHLVLAVASGCTLVELFSTLPSFLVAILNHTPSAGIQQGGRVGLSSVPHGKLVAYKSYT